MTVTSGSSLHPDWLSGFMGSEVVAAKIISCAFYFLIGLPWWLSSKKRKNKNKKLPANARDLGWILGSENPTEKEMATHSSIPVGKFHTWRSLVGYSSWGHKKSDMTERLRNNNYFLVLSSRLSCYLYSNLYSLLTHY